MQRKLLLTSMGVVSEIKDVFLGLLTKDPKDIKVSFILTAAFGEGGNLDWFYEDIDLLKTYGFGQIENLDLKDKTYQELKEILTEKDIIYVEGGNTFYLLKYVKESGFDKLLPELLDQGKLYIGASAGSMITGTDIESAGWEGIGVVDKNNVNLKDFSGMNIVPFAISPHFRESDRKVLDEESKKVNYPIVAITDKQAILCIDNKYQLIGEGEKLTYNDEKGVIK